MAGPGRRGVAPGTPKPANAGRKKGTPNKPKFDAAKIIENVAIQEFDHLTPAQIATITPLEVMLIAMKIEVTNKRWLIASGIAEKAAPYLHAKLAPKIVDDETKERVIKVIGGLPDGDD
jgi:hypothetical protein